ncbi:MAG TPA: DMT family transporter, partial [Candidatus Avelusimicrobium excrementipullorum]|nr:DMT family transporter [Candidatus Avelusimicrobium excrementipullorum]
NAFCKTVIRCAALDKILKLKRQWERQVSLDYLMNEKFVQFAASGLLLIAAGTGQFQRVPDWRSDVNLTLLALVCTVASNMTLVYAIKHLGSTRTSVLGAMESLTAVGVGVWVFGEPFTRTVALGIGLIILAVLTVVLSPWLTPFFRRFKYFYITEVLGRHKTLKAPR